MTIIGTHVYVVGFCVCNSGSIHQKWLQTIYKLQLVFAEIILLVGSDNKTIVRHV